MTIVETGIPGLISFSFLLYTAMLRIGTCHKALIKSPTPEVALTNACYLSAIGLFFMMLTWDALNHPTIRIYFWAIVGLAFRLQDLKTMRDRQ